MKRIFYSAKNQDDNGRVEGLSISAVIKQWRKKNGQYGMIYIDILQNTNTGFRDAGRVGIYLW